jgi:integrase
VRRRVLAKARERAEVVLPPLTPHSLRRTFCSIMLAIGVPVPAVQRELSHTDAKLTLNVYAQVMEYGAADIEALRSLVEGVELPVPEPAREAVGA